MEKENKKHEKLESKKKEMAEKIGKEKWGKMLDDHKKMFNSPEHKKKVAEGKNREAYENKYSV